MSPPAWGFFSTIVTMLGGIVVQQIRISKHATKAADNAEIAADNAEKARSNTVNVSNGFASGVQRDLRELQVAVRMIHENQLGMRDELSNHLRDHVRKDNVWSLFSTQRRH